MLTKHILLKKHKSRLYSLTENKFDILGYSIAINTILVVYERKSFYLIKAHVHTQMWYTNKEYLSITCFFFPFHYKVHSTISK